MQNNTHVTGANSVSITSGGDTNIIGSDVSGKHVSADVGGNLNIASVQDTTVSEAHQSSTSGGFSISQGGGSGSFSSQHGDAHGNYAGVNEQAGIQAGDGGFDVNVKGNTDLKGAAIASTADPSKNTLTTGTLTYSDIQNHSDYSASSSGFSAGTSGAMPMLSQHDSGSSSATTKSAVSAGTITVTDTANQKQDIASLNRDTTDTNGTVSKLPDVNNLLTNQADVMNAANAAGQAVAKDIGTYASYREASLKDGAKAANLLGETDLAAQYREDASHWAEGGDYRVGMHIVAGAVIGGLGGGSVMAAAGGAAGAGVSAALAPTLNDLSRAVADAASTGNAAADKIVGNVVANVVAGAAGALVGGNAGAFAASNEDLYNRQLHPQEKTLAQQLAAAANAKGITNADGSPVTATDIANQLAQMGYQANGITESGAAATVEGAKPNDGSTWVNAGVDQNTGKTIWTQVPGPANPTLQTFILQNTNGADVPLVQQYTASPVGARSQYGAQGIPMRTSAGSICPNGNCGIAYGSLSLPSPATITDLGSTGLGIAAIWAPPPFDVAAVIGSATLKSLNYLYSPPSLPTVVYDSTNAGVGAALPQGHAVQTLFGFGTAAAQPYVVPAK